jgi:hypothetical protein
MIICVESKPKVNRSFLVVADARTKAKPLPGFSVFDSTGKKLLYRLKTSSTDIDSMILIDYPAKNMVANAEGEWIDNIFNVSLSIYDYKLNKWTDASFRKIFDLFTGKYQILWNNESLIIKRGFFTKTIKMYNEKQNVLIAEFRYRSIWRSGFTYKYDLKIYSDKLSDAIYLFAVAIMHHTQKVSSENN